MYGMAYVTADDPKEAVKEIERCINNYNFIAVKLLRSHFIDDPLHFPIIEKCIELDIPILVHAGHSIQCMETQPYLSSGERFANIARIYPEANIIMAHIGGGGDWHWQIKAIADSPSIVCDMSGSITDAPMLEEAVAVLGADRILFGTDASYEASIGKILSANISEEDKKTILAGTAYERFLKRRDAK